MRLEIKIMQDDKTILLRVTDAEKISAVAGLDSGARYLFDDLLDLANDVAAANPDAGVVEISPENAVQVLGAMPLEPAPGGSTPGQPTAPAAETPAAASTVHDASSTIPPEEPAAAEIPAST